MRQYIAYGEGARSRSKATAQLSGSIELRDTGGQAVNVACVLGGQPEPGIEGAEPHYCRARAQ